MNDFYIKIPITVNGSSGDLSFRKKPDSCHDSQFSSSKYEYNKEGITLSASNECVHRDSELLLVGEVRLHNRRTILQEIGYKIQSQITDHCLVALCYKQWGIKCLNKLVGDFSFVLFDYKSKRLLAARDHLGVKQLYYRIDSDNILTISTSIKDIMEEKIDDLEEVDKEVLLDYLLGLLPDQNKTLFSPILQLPSGHYFTLYEGDLIVRKYWNLKISSTPRLFCKKFHKGRFLDLFKKVLRDRWTDNKKNVLLFSGGLDSTAILCGLRGLVHIEKNDLELLSHVNPQVEDDNDGGDKEYIQIALRKLGMETTYTEGSNSEIEESTLMSYFDDNYRMPWSPLIAHVSPLEISYGNMSGGEVFSGIGGDEVVSVDPKNKAIYLFLSGRWNSLYKLFKREEPTNGKTVFKNFQHSVLFRLLPDKLQEKYRNFRRVPAIDVIEYSFINPSHMNKKELVNYSKRKGGWWKQKRVYDPRKEIKIAVESGYFIPALEHANAISRRSRCNFNMPFLDPRIIEFCLSVPGIEFVREGVPRSFIRNCMRGYLPEEIENRSSKQLIGLTDDVEMMKNSKLFWSLAEQKDSSVWSILDRKRLIAAYSDLLDGKVRTEDRPVLGHQISKCINVIAFYIWIERKNSKNGFQETL